MQEYRQSAGRTMSRVSDLVNVRLCCLTPVCLCQQRETHRESKLHVASHAGSAHPSIRLFVSASALCWSSRTESDPRRPPHHPPPFPLPRSEYQHPRGAQRVDGVELSSADKKTTPSREALFFNIFSSSVIPLLSQHPASTSASHTRS